MNVDIIIKNYRCFSDTLPAYISLRPGFTAFIGINNSGKSTMLKFFYEMRSMFSTLSDGNSLVNALKSKKMGLQLPREVLDPKDIFCNSNERPLEIVFCFPSSSSQVQKVSEQEQLPIPKKLLIKVLRDGSYTAQICINKEYLPGSTQFDNYSGILRDADKHLASLEPVLTFFKNMAQVMYIGPFRNAINLALSGNVHTIQTLQDAHVDYYDISVGSLFIKKWREFNAGFAKELNRRTDKVVKDLKSIFNYKDLHIATSVHDQAFLFKTDGETYNLQEVGSGIAQFFVVLANAAVKNPSYIIIDEPELNLHPALQSIFLTKLAEYASTGGVIFSTHSIGLARSCAEQIYAFQRSQETGLSQVSLYEKTPRLEELLGELNYSAYQQLGFGHLLLVEGPTEVKTMQQFLRILHKDAQVVAIPLGGGTMINGAREGELRELKRITPNIFVLIDSEKDTPDAPLSPERAAFIETCKRLGINTHALNLRALENYFPERAIKKIKGDKYQALLPYEKLGTNGLGWSKAENWLLAQEMTKEELEASGDLGQFLASIQ